MVIRNLRLLLHDIRDHDSPQRYPRRLASMGLPRSLWRGLSPVHLDRNVRSAQEPTIARSIKVHSCLPAAWRLSRHFRPSPQEIFLDMRCVSIVF